MSTMKNFTAKLNLKSDAKPKFYSSHPVPFALRDSINQELNRLKLANIISKLCYSGYS